jgi:Ca2+-transporting ATPase
LGPFFGVEPPFTILQFLWINVIMDTFAAIALCSEPPRPGLMDLPPKRRDENILTRSMLWNIFTTAAFFVVVMMAMLLVMEGTPTSPGWFAGDHWLVDVAGKRTKVPARDLVLAPVGTWTQDGQAVQVTPFSVRQVSIFFTVYVLFQIWNEINCRSLVPSVSGLTGLAKSPIFLGIIGTIVVVQVLIVTFGGQVFQVEPLDPVTWLVMIGFTASVLIFAEATRRIRLHAQTG